MQPTTRTGEKSPARQVNILLVDDQPANLLTLRAILDDLGQNLVEARSGEEALRRLLEDEYAVVLLDVQMHGLDGFETARFIRNRQKSRHTPIIFLTAYDTDRLVVEQAYALGAVDFLVKPLVPVILKAKVSGFVELFQKTEQVKSQVEELRQVERREFDQRLAKENVRLREQREWLRVTLGSIGDAVIATDPAGRVVFLNPVAESLTGWKQKEAEGQTLESVFPIYEEGTRQAVEHPVAKVLREGSVVGLGNHTVLVAKDGTERPIDDSAAPITDGAGNVLGVVLIFRDVTEQRQSEKAVRESEARKAAILKTALDCIITMDHGGKIVEFNPAAERTFGYRRDEAMGQPLAELIIPPTLRDRHHRGLAHYLDTGEGPVLNRRIEMTALRADGTEFPVELAITRISPDGPPLFTAYLRDITERMRAERRRSARLAITQLLAQSATFHEAASGILQAICDGLEWDVGILWGVDRNANVLRCEEVWHRPEAQVAEFEALCRCSTFVPGVGLPGRVWASGKPTWMPDVQQDANFPRAPVAIKERLHGAFGIPILLGEEVLGVVEFLSQQIREPDPDLLEMMATIGGQIGLFSERRRAEEALREADRHKDEFLTMLAHELRNPLAPIRNGLQILKSLDADRQTVEKARTMMERQVGHMARIVDDLLDVSRITRGKIVLRMERLDLARLVRLVTEDERPAFDHAGLMLEVNAPEIPVWVMGDATRLTQVLQNLLQNAIKFTDRGGRVHLHVGVDKGKTVLAVRDTGIGIETGVLPHLFETFAQADRSLDRSKGGLGLGLALVKGLVELHGGEVQASSAGLGRGAEFTAQFTAEPEPAAITAMPTVPSRDGRHLRILVVEDNQDSADSLRMLLELYGYEVTVAYSGPAGVKTAEEWRPDVVLCDIGLPGLNGYGVVGKLRCNPATAKARMIAVTGYGTEEERRRSREAGFDHHMVKPVDPEALQELLSWTDTTGTGGRREP